jgi:Eukaryotic aspartyl protease
VTAETNLFYYQEADGILGMTKAAATSVHLRPIYDVMYEQNLIEKKLFTLCMGKDGGYFQIGGYDSTSHLSPTIKWVPLIKNEPYAYRMALKGVSMNGHIMKGSHIFDVGVIDSGTTFTYVPEKLFKILVDHLDWFCFLDTENHCKGRRIFNGNPNPGSICFHYDELQF